jgi:magnesium chelatase family protein
LLDRIDIFVDVPDVKVSDFTQNRENIEKSVSIRERVMEAREIQAERYKNSSFSTNAEADGHELEHYLANGALEILHKCIDRNKISARGYYRVIKLARTLADIAKSDSIGREHVTEAMSYRRML